MKLKFKVLIVCACFVIFYVVTGAIWIGCNMESICEYVTIFATHILIVIPDHTSVEYDGSVQGVEKTDIRDIIYSNISFMIIMLVSPLCIIIMIQYLHKL